MMKRNEKDIYDRIVELADKHIDMVDGSDNIFLQEEKIKAVKAHYQNATDWDNPNRDKYKVTEEMHGRIVGNVMSYALMDNDKYHEIEELLEIMEFGTDSADLSMQRANTFAGMGSYYQKSKSFYQGPQQTG
jgi:molybdopterin-guanine dinucleotide biosynthesis protein